MTGAPVSGAAGAAADGDSAADGDDGGLDRVSTLELFFDLVFVFAISQVALIVERHAAWSAVAQAMLELAMIYWLNGGFAWLTNAIWTRTPRQCCISPGSSSAVSPRRPGPWCASVQ